MNIRKHNVAFDEASTVFGDPLALLWGTRIIHRKKNVTCCSVGRFVSDLSWWRLRNGRP
jgi:uncharacterized DUF497 family protein